MLELADGTEVVEECSATRHRSLPGRGAAALVRIERHNVGENGTRIGETRGQVVSGSKDVEGNSMVRHSDMTAVACGTRPVALRLVDESPARATGVAGRYELGSARRPSSTSERLRRDLQ